jgi:hypothetical protein
MYTEYAVRNEIQQQHQADLFSGTPYFRRASEEMQPAHQVVKGHVASHSFVSSQGKTAGINRCALDIFYQQLRPFGRAQTSL